MQCRRAQIYEQRSNSVRIILTRLYEPIADPMHAMSFNGELECVYAVFVYFFYLWKNDHNYNYNYTLQLYYRLVLYFIMINVYILL